MNVPITSACNVLYTLTNIPTLRSSENVAGKLIEAGIRTSENYAWKWFIKFYNYSFIIPSSLRIQSEAFERN
jgi:hypothetical protein